jgi:hypothetical protein
MNGSSFTHGLPHDPAMPGFCAALDADVFGREVRSVVERSGLALVRCVLDRFRYRRGERLVVVYRVETADRRRGSSKPLTITGRIHAARPGLTKSEDRENCGELARTAYLPALGMRLEIFPEDRRLPELRSYVENPCAPRMTRLLRAATGWIPSHSNEIAVELVRYRPGIAATLRYRPRSAGSEDQARECFIKLSALDGARRTASGSAIVNHALKRDRAKIELVEPAISDPQSGVAAYARAPGHSLEQTLRSSGSLAASVQTAGRAMARLHLVDDSALPRASGEQALHMYLRAAHLLAWACPEARPALDQIETAAAELFRNGVVGAIHGDLKPDHVFVSNESGEVRLIDADSVSVGNPLLDIGSLLVRLEAMAWLDGIDEPRTSEAAACLCEAYFGIVPDGWRRQIGPARALAALLVCQHAVQRLLPGWRNRVRVELEKAATLI